MNYLAGVGAVVVVSFGAGVGEGMATEWGVWVAAGTAVGVWFAGATGVLPTRTVGVAVALGWLDVLDGGLAVPGVCVCVGEIVGVATCVSVAAGVTVCSVVVPAEVAVDIPDGALRLGVTVPWLVVPVSGRLIDRYSSGAIITTATMPRINQRRLWFWLFTLSVGSACLWGVFRVNAC